ncbi:Zinc finger protein [Nesidiocoris tenuis]|uniref:Zinc finger protein n=1 Tax=Nesidiocoris tenuis TaxID=355587 RepID=A0ABN7AQM2_9HEMI|nr:Zinc finger protein [Nesidiocoris tenuis]
MTAHEKPLFRDLDPDEAEPEVTEVESLCMNCQSNGITRILLTKIPYYKEVVLMSFECMECGYKNNEIQPGGTIEEQGVRATLRVQNIEDMNRKVVKSDHCCVKIPHIDFEIPSQTQKGEVTTVEGVISRAITGLEQDQPARRKDHPEAAILIDDFVKKLEDLKLVSEPFTIIFEDISGNSFVENPYAPKADPHCKKELFHRTAEQDHLLGIFSREEVSDGTTEVAEPNLLPGMGKDSVTYEDLQGEVLTFKTNCSNCNTPCDTNMKVTRIPHFKEVIIMATSCDACGHRTNEVKSSGGIEEKGVRLEVKVRGTEDFSRDILKSETCSLSIPEIDLEAGSMTITGKFTTVEGLLKDIQDGIQKGGIEYGIFGDTKSEETTALINRTVTTLKKVLEGSESITLILDDPAGNSYVQTLADDAELDDGLKIVHYERTYDQNEELGINDMKTENYENDA